ncbi:MAG: SDR family NAD(P)-dependent oxidoreductase [Burkholderiaceae bacterium]
MAIAPVRRVRNAVLKDLGLPEDMLTFVNYPTRFDCRETLAALRSSGRGVPQPQGLRLAHLGLLGASSRPELFIDRTLRGHCGGQGRAGRPGSSGIGLAAAQVRRGGRHRLICGRDQAKLDEACAEAKAKGYAFIARPILPTCRTVTASCSSFIADHGGVDFLINNAGRSIRRAIESSYDRFHDYERTMQLNYFGCLRVTMGLLPGMVEKRKGHVVNISSIGVLTIHRASRPTWPARPPWTPGRAALRASLPTRASRSLPSTCPWCARP